MPQPVGVVLFGVGCKLKDDVGMQCLDQIRGLVAGYDDKGVPINATGKTFSKGKNALVTMRNESSCDREQRRQTVATLRDLGAKSIAGIYIKPASPTPTFLETASPATIQQLCWFEQNPPTNDEFDRLLILDEKRRGSHV